MNLLVRRFQNATDLQTFTNTAANGVGSIVSITFDAASGNFSLFYTASSVSTGGYLGSVQAPTGTISTTDGSSKNNATTAATFVLTGASRVVIQPDVAVYVVFGTSSAVTATSANGLKILADSAPDFTVAPGVTHLAIIPVTGTTANVKVWSM